MVIVSLCLAPEEPEAGPWRAERLPVVAATMMRSDHGKSTDRRPFVLAVDGRSSSAGRPVSYRPPRWDQRQRPGAIEVPADCPLLIIEGVGAARRESARLTDAAIWVQADECETERRNLARVGRPGGSTTMQHMREWMAEEMPFLAGRRPWEHAGLIACGTPQIPFDPATELVVAPPLARSCHPGKGGSLISPA